MLYSNQLTGTIPIELASMTSLSEFEPRGTFDGCM